MIDIHKFYRREAHILLMYAHVTALARHFKGMSQKNAVRDFIEAYGLSEELNEESLLVEYNRMVKEYRNK